MTEEKSLSIMTEGKSLHQIIEEYQQNCVESNNEKIAKTKDSIEKLKTIVSENLETIKEIIEIANTGHTGFVYTEGYEPDTIFGVVDSDALLLNSDMKSLEFNADRLDPKLDVEYYGAGSDFDERYFTDLTIRLANGDTVNHNESVRDYLPPYVEIDLNSEDLSVYSNIRNRDVNMLEYLVDKFDVASAKQSIIEFITSEQENENKLKFVEFN